MKRMSQRFSSFFYFKVAVIFFFFFEQFKTPQLLEKKRVEKKVVFKPKTCLILNKISERPFNMPF